eukprot:404019-Amphidinium_carterae.1
MFFHASLWCPLPRARAGASCAGTLDARAWAIQSLSVLYALLRVRRVVSLYVLCSKSMQKGVQRTGT